LRTAFSLQADGAGPPTSLGTIGKKIGHQYRESRLKPRENRGNNLPVVRFGSAKTKQKLPPEKIFPHRG
jgi:hypothetical protein